jgi:hypothetical protein
MSNLMIVRSRYDGDIVINTSNITAIVPMKSESAAKFIRIYLSGLNTKEPYLDSSETLKDFSIRLTKMGLLVPNFPKEE